MYKLLQIISLLSISLLTYAQPAPHYTVINDYDYHSVVSQSRRDVNNWLFALNEFNVKGQCNAACLNKKIIYLAQELAGIPYSYEGAQGEGDWQLGSWRYVGGAKHIQQDPVYRTDELDCQTLVQLILALLHSKDLAQFDQTILRIDYGAAGEPANRLSYYNRNHFMSADFIPINQKNGFLNDMTGRGSLAKYSRTTEALLDRQRWFQFKARPLEISDNVRVLSEKNGQRMAAILASDYPNRYKKFPTRRVNVSYISKEEFILKERQRNGVMHYFSNEELIDQIPTPALVVIVRDSQRWAEYVDGRRIFIKDYIGTELSESHVGIVYRQNFHRGEVVAHEIECHYGFFFNKVCEVMPRICTQETCNELMFLAASSAYPDGYYWYQKNGQYVCSAYKPNYNTHYTSCNRVTSMPLTDYLMQYHYGRYIYMQRPSILGIHFERILS